MSFCSKFHNDKKDNAISTRSTKNTVQQGLGWQSLSGLVLLIDQPKGLVTNYGEGGYTTGVGGASEVSPLRKGGGASFSHAKGGKGEEQVLG